MFSMGLCLMVIRVAGANSMASRHAPMMAEQHVPPFNDYVDPVESARAFRHHARQGGAPRNMNKGQQDGPWQQDRGFAHQGAAFGMQNRAFGQGGFAPSAPHVSEQGGFAHRHHHLHSLAVTLIRLMALLRRRAVLPSRVLFQPA